MTLYSAQSWLFAISAAGLGMSAQSRVTAAIVGCTLLTISGLAALYAIASNRKR